MNDSKSILVVGGAGYLGSVLTEELLCRGYAVTIFDRLFFGDAGLERIRDRVRLLAGDVRALPPSVLENISAIINVSGLSNDPTAEYNPAANYQMNTVAAKKLGDMARQHGIERYILASSCSVYDVGVADEERDVLFTEESAVQPRAAYALSKLAAERELLAIQDERFSPVILRMGTLFGFSPRMRYDLVVNTFVKDAFRKGYLTLHYGGQMWRPLCDVRDAARAYIVALEAEKDAVAGQVFNVAMENFRISEVALRVREALREKNIPVEIRSAFEYTGIRSYRVSGQKIHRVLNFRPAITVEESVKNMAGRIRECGCDDFDNDRYYNIRWMKLLEQVRRTIEITGSIFEMPEQESVVDVSSRKVTA